MSSILKLIIDEKWPETGGLGPVKWAISGKGTGSANSGVAFSLSELPVTDHVEVIIPASAALLTSVKVPEKNLRLFKKTLRFAVENQIISDPEAVHVVAGPVGADNVMPVAIADRGWMMKTLDILADNGVYPRAMLVETLLLPMENGGWSVSLSKEGGAVRTGPFAGAPIDVEEDGSAPPMLEMALSEARKAETTPSGIKIYLMNGSAPLDVKSWEERLGVPVKVAGPRADSDGGSERDRLNLMQGEFAPAMRIKALIPHLKIPAVLLTLAMCLHVGYYFAEWKRMKTERDSLTTETAGIFQKVFPEITAVTDPETQMSEKLRELKTLAGENQDSGEFLALLGKTGLLLPAGAKMRGAKYGPSGLELKLVLAGEKDSKAFRDKLAALGLEVTVRDTPKEEGKGFPAEFSINEKAAVRTVEKK